MSHLCEECHVQKYTLEERLLFAIDLIVDIINGRVPDDIVKDFTEIYVNKFDEEPSLSILKLAIITEVMINWGIGKAVEQGSGACLVHTNDLRIKIEKEIGKYLDNKEKLH